MTKLKKGLKIVLINIIVLALLLELVSLAIYFFKRKTLFYTHKQRTAGQETIALNIDRQLTDKRFHPFFGYTYKPGQKKTNNYGFNCPHNYPLKREQENWYFIGIFGGSVADDFYRDGTERLTADLQRHPYFAEKEIIYLNYAAGGYKQPQQMQALTYFLAVGQELDLVINIDGFNEMVFCSNNNRLNVDIAMPSAQHFLPMRDLVDSQAVTGDKLISIWKIQRYKQAFDSNKKTMERTPFASVYLILSAYNKYLYKKYQGEILRFDGLIKPATPVDSIINVKYTRGTDDETLLMSKIASLWSRCSLIMSRSLSARKQPGRYFHFLQPNQYYSNKTFSGDEQRIALDQQSPYSFLVKKGYPFLLQAIENLQKNHVHAFSAAEVFDGLKETIYIDNCCHFNRQGNEKFADFIAGCILEKLK